ncbi:MAG: adenosylcobinamide-phosphate synthase CbiB [Pseudomonadota bacterium]
MPVLETALALLLDRAAGEPPEAVHPVCWMGKAVAACERAARLVAPGPEGLRAAGAVMAVALPGGVFALTRLALGRLPGVLRLPAEAALISTAMAPRGLGEAAARVEEGLGEGLAEGRREVSRMVGRDTEDLQEEGVVRAAVESVAENANDGVVAPLLYAMIGGAPMALAYRMVNTLDSMIGYRSERHRELGWAAARLDDAAGYLPARACAGAAVLVAPLAGGSPLAALRVWKRDAAGHASPNAGVCEAAFAGALGARLGGPASYGGVAGGGHVMGEGLRPPARTDISRAVRLMRAVTVLVMSAGVAARLLARPRPGRPRVPGRRQR